MSENSKVKFTTNKGVFVAEIFEDKAPNTAKNFLDLVNKGFYRCNPLRRIRNVWIGQSDT